MGNVYVFSLFVFFLVALLMVLFFVLLRIFNQRGLELEKKKLVRLYESLEQDVNEYKNFVAATREKMEQDMHRFLRRIETSRQQEEGLTLKNIKKLIDQPGEELKKQSQPGKDAGAEEPDRKKRIRDYASKGLSPLQIAQRLGVSLSEVELVLGLNGTI